MWAETSKAKSAYRVGSTEEETLENRDVRRVLAPLDQTRAGVQGENVVQPFVLLNVNRIVESEGSVGFCKVDLSTKGLAAVLERDLFLVTTVRTFERFVEHLVIEERYIGGDDARLAFGFECIRWCVELDIVDLDFLEP